MKRIAIVLLSLLALVITACGGSSSTVSPSSEATATSTASNAELTVQNDDPQKYLAASSVGEGNGPAPVIAPAVKAAAHAAGCTTRADASPFVGRPEPSNSLPWHVENPDYSTQPSPPTSGVHFPIWADWGIYDTAVPYKFLVHNMEHGGIIVYEGAKLAAPTVSAITKLWYSAPPYVVVVPAVADVTPAGVTVTSWQRALTCPRAGAKTIAAISAFRNAYRGQSREQVPAVNAGQPADGLPTPATADPAAAGG